jgi:hypothetical protein
MLSLAAQDSHEQGLGGQHARNRNRSCDGHRRYLHKGGFIPGPSARSAPGPRAQAQTIGGRGIAGRVVHWHTGSTFSLPGSVLFVGSPGLCLPDTGPGCFRRRRLPLGLSFCHAPRSPENAAPGRATTQEGCHAYACVSMSSPRAEHARTHRPGIRLFASIDGSAPGGGVKTVCSGAVRRFIECPDGHTTNKSRRMGDSAAHADFEGGLAFIAWQAAGRH